MTTDRDHDHKGHTIAEAATILGISPEAVRQRVKRGTLASYTAAGRRYVLLPDAPTDTGSADHDADRDELVAQLRCEVAYLRERIERQEHIIAGLVQRVPPALPDGTATDPPQPPPEPPERPLWRRLWPW